MRYLIEACLALFLLLLLIWAGDQWLNTRTGLVTTYQILRTFVPGQLTIDDLEGSLAGEVQLNNVRYQNNHINVLLPKVSFHIQAYTLWNNQIKLSHLDITGGVISSRTTTPFQLSSLLSIYQMLQSRHDWLNHIWIEQLNLTNLSFQPSGIQLTLQGKLTNQWQTTWSLRNTTHFFPTIKGTLVGDPALPTLHTALNLAPLSNKIPTIGPVTGQLIIDLGGRNNCLLTNVNFFVPHLNIYVNHLSLQIQNGINRTLTWQGRANFSPGVVNLTGTTQLNSNFTTHLHLSGQNATIWHTKIIQITASPNVNIDYQNQLWRVTGIGNLPQVKIDLGHASESVVTLSNDVIFEGEKKSDFHLEIPYTLSLQLIPGRAELLYQGLYTQLTGKLILTASTKDPFVVNGQLNCVNGKYSYYNQTLDLNSGSRLIYAKAPFSNPALDAQVSRTVTALPSPTLSTTNLFSNLTPAQMNTSTLFNQPSTVVVGIHVSGTAQQPKFILFANPPILNQSDILAYLLTGQSSTQMGAVTSQLLFNAANSLNPTQGKISALMNEVQKTIGLSQLTIASNNIVNPKTNTLIANTSLVLGKQISSKLSINYNVGLLANINILQIRYMLNNYFTLQTTSSTFGNGIDLLYTLEH